MKSLTLVREEPAESVAAATMSGPIATADCSWSSGEVSNGPVSSNLLLMYLVRL
jgi:hypothetical protein